MKTLNSEKTAREKAGGAALAKGAQTKRADGDEEAIHGKQ